MLYIGIDPGKTGSLAIYDSNSKSVDFFDWPKDDNIGVYFSNLEDVLMNLDIELAALEQVHGRPGQDSRSVFNFGKYFGIWSAWLAIYKVSHKLISPLTWKAKLKIPKATSKDVAKARKEAKENAYDVAYKLFPNATLKGPKGGLLDGRVDALLLAYYASKF